MGLGPFLLWERKRGNSLLPLLFFTNIYGYNHIELNQGILEQNRLINTLKRLMGDYSDEPNISISDKVKKYMDLKFGELVQVPNQEDLIYFVNSFGKVPMSYHKKNNNLRVSSPIMTSVQEMFGIEEDFVEEILKKWVNEKYGLPIKFVDYY